MDSRDYRNFVNDIIKAKKTGELSTQESRDLLNQVMKETGNRTIPFLSIIPEESTYDQDIGAKG